MNPFNPYCIARGLVAENRPSINGAEDAECRASRIFAVVVPETGVVARTFGVDSALSVCLKSIATALVEKDMSPFALMLSAQQGKDENLFKQEMKWGFSHTAPVSILAEIEYHSSVPGVSVKTVGDPDSWSHLLVVLVYYLLKEGFPFDAIIDCLQTGARNVTKM